MADGNVYRVVFCCEVDFAKCKKKVFPLRGKVVFIWNKNLSVSKQYLGTRQKVSSHMNAI